MAAPSMRCASSPRHRSTRFPAGGATQAAPADSGFVHPKLRARSCRLLESMSGTARPNRMERSLPPARGRVGKSSRACRISGEAEALLLELASVFAGVQEFLACLRIHLHELRSQFIESGSEVSRAARADSGRRLHGVSRSRRQRGICQSGDRSGAWATRAKSGSKIRFAGTTAFILTTSSAGALKQPICFFPASRFAPPIASWRATAASSGSTAMPAWCAAPMARPGSSMAWPSISLI